MAHQYRAFLFAYSDFKRSEMLGLEWKNVDFENNVVSINRTSNYTAKRGIYTVQQRQNAQNVF